MQKADLEKRIAANQEMADRFDRDIGPFEAKYHNMTGDMEALYGAAKVEHAKGLEVLMNEFKYHPIFKRWSDQFSGVPFRPM